MIPFVGKSEKEADVIMFALYDTKAEHYREPMRQRNVALLIRELENVFKRPESRDLDFVMNPEDFQVFKVGEYTLKTGKLVGCAPQHIINLHEIAAAVRSQLQPIPAPGALSST